MEYLQLSWELGGGDEAVVRFVVLRGWLERLKGLCGTQASAPPVVLLDCSSIHTFGMDYPIDVAFTNEEGLVLAASRGLPPRRVFSSRRAALAFERPSNEEPWPRRGNVTNLRWIND